MIYGIDATTREIDEGAPKQSGFTDFGVQGKNDGGGIGYTGPCPPAGTHHYVARLYALDTELELEPGATRRELEVAMQGHIIDQPALSGTYTRQTDIGREKPSAAA